MEVVNLVAIGGREIFNFPVSSYLYGIFFFFLIYSAELFCSFKLEKIFIDKKLLKLSVCILLFVCLISSHIIHAYADAKNIRIITSSANILPLFKPLTAKRFFQKHNIIETADALEFKNDDFFDSKLDYPPKNLQFESSENLNILFILVDSLRFDMIEPEIMPSVFNFAKNDNTLQFKNHLSGGNGTREGIFTLFYGLAGTYWNAIEDEGISPLLINTLLSNNYQTGIFGSATLKAPPFHDTVFSRIKNLRIDSDGSTAWERDVDITKDWLEWIDKKEPDKSFFGFLFYDAAHSYSFPSDFEINDEFRPYLDKIEYHKLGPEYNSLPMKNRYKITLSYIDTLITEVLDDLEKRNLLDNTIVLISGDHGEEFNDSGNNYWGHGGNFTDYQVKVPMIIHWPGKKSNNFSHLTSHLDIAPTLLNEVFRLKNSASEISNGKNLFNENERKWVFSGGFSKKAIIEHDRITVSYPTGFYEIYNRNFNPIEDATLRPNIYKEVLDEQVKFHKKM
jgi:membrane-anchored protein YejM (alkaline phosphatase superfamily)